MNAKLTELRRRMHAEAEGMAKPVLKGIRWLLLKREEHLNEANNEKARLKQALELNQPLMTAYYLNEELGQLWQQPNKITEERFLKNRCNHATESGIKVLQTMTKTLQAHRSAVLNWYGFRISSAPL